jgi:hypothetical protein
MGKVKNFFHDEIVAMQEDPMFAEFDMQHDEDNPWQVQVGGDHYKNYAIQPTEYIIQNDLSFCQGNVVKYVTRYKDKGGIDDLKKARHYLDMLIHQEEEPLRTGNAGIEEGTDDTLEESLQPEEVKEIIAARGVA